MSTQFHLFLSLNASQGKEIYVYILDMNKSKDFGNMSKYHIYMMKNAQTFLICINLFYQTDCGLDQYD